MFWLIGILSLGHVSINGLIALLLTVAERLARGTPVEFERTGY
jgi:hypothetical protein